MRPLAAAETHLVPELWNAAWGGSPTNPYPLSAELWREKLGSRHHEPSLLLGAFESGELLGVTYGKLPRSHWQPPNGAWVSLLAVDPRWQGRGLGARLLARLLLSLGERGATALRFGGDADHLLPGPPQESGPATWRLLRRFGARFGAAEHDLHLDLRPELPAAPLPASWRLRSDDPRGAAESAARLFPGRWSEEVADYVAAGAVPITLERHVSGEASSSATPEGFCAIFHGGERVTSPGLHWAEALNRELAGPEGRPVVLAGIGPLGIAPEVRGTGAGLALVRGAAQHLRERGATDAIINWTGLTKFYGRLGARLWRSYQYADAAMPGRELLAAMAEGHRA